MNIKQTAIPVLAATAMALQVNGALISASQDSFIIGSDTNTGTESLLSLKRHQDDNANYTQKIYLSFDLNGGPYDLSQSAALNMTFHSFFEQSSTPYEQDFEVFALNAGTSGYDWDETSIDWSNSPGGHSTNYSFDSAKTTSVGTFIQYLQHSNTGDRSIRCH